MTMPGQVRAAERLGPSKGMERLARGLRALFAALRRLGIPPAAAMSEVDLRSNAYGLSYAVLATLWQKRSGATAWDEVYRRWEAGWPAARDVEPQLYGRFAADDRWRLLTDNAESFRVRGELFASAKRTIDIATYYLQADETSWWAAKSLAECAGRGVRVRILADGMATSRKAYEEPAVAEVVRRLRAVGVDYRLFRDRARPYDASHRKLLLVDGETLLTGGRNFADHYSGDEWRDIDVWLQGPGVAAAQALFDESFAAVDGYPGGATPRGILQSTTPASVAENGSFRYLLQCLRASERTFDIENAYYINHSAIFRQIVAARERGVRVRIFTNSAESNDLDFTNYRIYLGFADLLRAGVEVYLRQGRGRTLHGKYFVGDGEWVGFGSSNLDYYSPRFCGEAGLQVRDPSFAAALTEWFEAGLQEAARLQHPAEAEAVIRRQSVGRVFDRWFRDIQ